MKNGQRLLQHHGKVRNRLDQVLRVRVKKLSGNTEEGNVLPCSVFDGQEQFVQFSINDVCMQYHILSNVEKSHCTGTYDRKGCLQGMMQ